MKMQFNMVIQGNETLEKKFYDSIQKNPKIQTGLIQGFGQTIILGLGLDETDNISIVSFRVGRIDEELYEAQKKEHERKTKEVQEAQKKTINPVLTDELEKVVDDPI